MTPLTIVHSEIYLEFIIIVILSLGRHIVRISGPISQLKSILNRIFLENKFKTTHCLWYYIIINYKKKYPTFPVFVYTHFLVVFAFLDVHIYHFNLFSLFLTLFFEPYYYLCGGELAEKQYFITFAQLEFFRH